MGDEKKIESIPVERLSLFITEWVKALECMTVGEFVGDNPRAPIALSYKLSLKGAVEVLTSNHLKSAPVYDDSGKFIGLLNFGTILKYCLETKQKMTWLFGVGLLSALTDPKYGHKMKRQTEKSSILIHLARQKRFYTVDVKQTLLELGQKLRNIPSVGVTHEGKLISIVSQGHFMRAMIRFGWLDDLRVTLGDMVEARKCPTKLDTCTEEISTYSAFFEMARLNRSAMGVLEERSGVFLGSINLMDTTVFVDLNYQDLDTNVSKYLQKKKCSALVCDKETLFLHAILKICSKKSNRIWVVEEKKVVALCSLTDVLALLS